jgi:SAM-dependent methyltransferase
MSLYQRAFARLLALGDDAQHRIYGATKRRLLGGLAGTVVEIGPGTGLNLAYLPRGVRYVGLEPNPHVHARIRAAARRHGHAAEVRGAPAEASGLPDACADAVVSTLVLCSVDDPQAVLREVQRLLRPGGRFVFIEHVATHGQPDVLIVDPPRAGLHEDVVAHIAALGPRARRDVSCNPQTQVRDLDLLRVTYRLDAVQPVGMFPHTPHIENVARLTRCDAQAETEMVETEAA